MGESPFARLGTSLQCAFSITKCADARSLFARVDWGMTSSLRESIRSGLGGEKAHTFIQTCSAEMGRNLTCLAALVAW